MSTVGVCKWYANTMFSKMILHKSGVIFLTMLLTISYMSITHSLPASTALATTTTPTQQSSADSINNNNNNTVTTKMAYDNSNNPSSMIGQLIDVEQGKTLYPARVIPPETPDGTFKMEVSYSGGGILNGINVTEMWTFVNTYRPNGVIQGVGQGAISTKDHTEIASAIGYGMGIFNKAETI